MIKELAINSIWYVADNSGEKYVVTVIYVNNAGNQIVGLTSLGNGTYIEYDFLEFYRDFTYTSQNIYNECMA